MNSDLIEKWRRKSLASHRPMKASIELTNRCNERCTHCYLDSYSDDPQRVLSVGDWKQVFDQLRSAGVLYLDLMGGEAMLHPRFWELAEYAVGAGFYTGMITNGLRMTPEAAARLAGMGFSTVTLSIYGLDPGIHDSMTRVKGSHRRAMEALAALREAGVDVSVNCLLTTENIDHYYEFEDWCIREGVRMTPDPYVTPTFSGGTGPVRRRATREQLLRFYRERASRWARGVPRPSTDTDEDYVCGAGKVKCAVTAYGELLTCIDVREPLGLLTESSFDELWWNSPVALRWREMRQAGLKGKPDGESGSFCEHCPACSKIETGDAARVTDYSRLLAEVKLEVAREFSRRAPAADSGEARV